MNFLFNYLLVLNAFANFQVNLVVTFFKSVVEHFFICSSDETSNTFTLFFFEVEKTLSYYSCPRCYMLVYLEQRYYNRLFKTMHCGAGVPKFLKAAMSIKNIDFFSFLRIRLGRDQVFNLFTYFL